MTDEEQVKRVFQNFVEGGLVSRNLDQVLSCIAKRVIGFGIGEQGFVNSGESIQRVLESGIREDDQAVYSLVYDRLEIQVYEGRFANACGEVRVSREEKGSILKSSLLQSLVFIKEEGDWKICGLHASAPVITEETMEAYPLKIAEKLLRNLRKEIGEKAYRAEEQFQRAVLADTIAFYILNITKNCFEKCQVNQKLCAYVTPGTPYEKFVRENVHKYVAEKDCDKFLETLSLDSIAEAIRMEKSEISCEYRLKRPDGTEFWAVTVIRLIADCMTGDRKGIMYVKDIDKEKHREKEMKSRAERDDMTSFYNKATFVQKVKERLEANRSAGGAFVMLDVDNFKKVNDTFGHPFGDHVLISAAGIIREVFGKDNIFGRLGGDEFGIFIDGGDARKLKQKETEELMQRLAQIRMPEQDAPPVSCSIGLVDVQCGISFEILYQQADQAMYCSKQEGKQRCTIYERDA